MPFGRPLLSWIAFLLALAPTAPSQVEIRVMPPDGATMALGQRFDIRVEAKAPDGSPAPAGLTVRFDDQDLTARNLLDPGLEGERGRGGTGAAAAGLDPKKRASPAPANTTNFLLRDFSCDKPGPHVIRARTAEGAEATVPLEVYPWTDAAPTSPPVRNFILFLGDGMGAAHRTAARIVSRGLTRGKPNAPLAMDRMEVTGLVMTASLNAAITDSAPGMSCYVTSNKSNNNQEGVFPDNTLDDPFDNPRVEYFGEMLRRVRGEGFRVGIVTTADLTDATPAANAVHTADRNAGPGIAERFFDERAVNGVSVLLGGGGANFRPKTAEGGKQPSRDLEGEMRADGFAVAKSRTDLLRLLESAEPPAKALGLFHDSHMTVAFDKVGAGRYSDELALKKNAAWRDPPMLDEMARLALRVLSRSATAGFYLMVEGASIDKRAHAADAERTIWDVIEFDNAVAVALEFAERTNKDADPANDTLVLVTADHECGGMAPIGVGNALYLPEKLGRAERDYCAVFRFKREQVLELFPNYEVDARGYPKEPDPSRKLLMGWAAATDRFENWLSNRIQQEAAVESAPQAGGKKIAVANPARDGLESGAGVDNVSVARAPVPGFLVAGTIENGQADGGPSVGDQAAAPHTFGGHTATDVPLSASGPAAVLFTGTYDNTLVMRKLLLASSGSYTDRLPRR